MVWGSACLSRYASHLVLLVFARATEEEGASLVNGEVGAGHGGLGHGQQIVDHHRDPPANGCYSCRASY